MKKKSFSIIIKLVAVFSAITILFSACGNGVSTKTIHFKELKEVSSEYAGDNLHKSTENAYKSVCTSGLIEMLFDETNCTVAIRDTNSGNLWTTLPSDSTTKQIVSSPIEPSFHKNADNAPNKIE